MGIVLTRSAPSEQVREESLWFGAADRPLFGRLTSPVASTSRGGVLLSPPIDREARLARRALRSLAIFLAMDGYVSLRFDHYGTGDSSGSMDDEFDRSWVEGVDQGAVLLRSLGIDSLSAVGMRIGATILGAAASAYDLRLSSVVMWDPCESGRAYLRELSALGALRRDVATPEVGEPDKMSEYVHSDDAARRLSEFHLGAPALRPLAERVLIVVREDRVVSSKFRTRWSSEHVEWTTTTEQGTMLETWLPLSVQPASTIAQIRKWLTEPAPVVAPFRELPRVTDAVVTKASNAYPVRESFVELGPQKMFGVLSESTGEAQGPLIVMVNGINEDHVGPSRLWVELARRWSGAGLRCVRFDLGELGESPWSPNQLERAVYDKTRPVDICDAVRALMPVNPADSVLIGLCSGAQLAIEAALELKSRGVCAINPQVGTSIFRSADRLEKSDREFVRSITLRLETFLKRHLWVGKAVRQVSRLVVSSAYSPRVRSALVKNGSEILVIASPDDLSPFPRMPILGSIDRRRLVSSEHCRVEIVPGLDHDFLGALARDRAVTIVDEHVLEKFAGITP